MNTERFEERLMLELKTRVRERAQEQERQAGAAGVADAVEALVSRRRVRRRLRFGTFATATGAAVAIATTVFTATSSTVAGGTTHHPLFHVANAAYAVQQEPTGIVKLTILDANGKPNVAQLRSDLAKAGINARVLADVPDCQHPQPRPSPEETPLPLPPAGVVAAHSEIENGKLVFFMDPRVVVPGEMFSLLFGKSLQTTEMALSRPDEAPTCFANGANF